MVPDFFGGRSKKRIIPHFSNNQESFSHYTELIDYILFLALFHLEVLFTEQFHVTSM